MRGPGCLQGRDAVDFRLLLGKLLEEFDRGRIRYALMGGFALGVWGVPRARVYMDFLEAGTWNVYPLPEDAPVRAGRAVSGSP